MRKRRPNRKKLSRPFCGQIGVEEQDGGWRLLAVGELGVLPAGPRLLKSEPWPIEKFVYETEAEANKAAEKLARYLDTTTTLSASEAGTQKSR